MADIQNPELPLDMNKIIADFASQVVSAAAGSAYGKGKHLLKGLTDDVRLKLEKTYSAYLKEVYQHYSKAKSFLIRDEATRLYDFYVPMGLHSGKRKVVEADINDFTDDNRFAVIRGGAGSGKSMMMRHLFVNAIEKKVKVPIFIELRRTNDFDGDLFEFIKYVLEENHFALDDEFIEKALKKGDFAIFLDGFDEVAQSKKKFMIAQIKSLSMKYPQCVVIVSSRPDEEFASWNRFTTWNISPLTLNQALRLIKKVPSQNIDDETRNKFLSDLEKELFERHESFLSNPLLLSIMAITYANSGDVPQKISTFYENAYIALFERHDALKGAFKRDRRCSLDILDFKKIFSAFSILTFNNLVANENDYMASTKSLRFPKTDALSFIEEAAAISDVKTAFTSDDFLEDATRAVCLLVEDGLEFTFAHRSFQEYFTAVFISRLDDPIAQSDLIVSYFTVGSSRVAELLFEIDPTAVEKGLVIPFLERYVNAIQFSQKLSFDDYIKALEYFLVSLEYDKEFFELAADEEVVTMVLSDPRSVKGEGISFPLFVLFALSNYLDKYDISRITESTAMGLNALKPKPKRKVRPTSPSGAKAVQKSQKDRNNLLKDRAAMKLLANDPIWAFNLNNIQNVLRLERELKESHSLIDKARKTNLLVGLKQRTRN